MTAPYLLWAAIACILFWCVGVYNRVMRLRARGFDAFGSLEKHLRHYGAIVRTLSPVGEGHASFAASMGQNAVADDWAHLIVCLGALDQSLKLARPSPFDSEGLARVSAACADLGSAWTRVKAAPADLAGSALPEELERHWEDSAQRARSATEGFNQIMQKYNEATSQFPARLICRLFGFTPIALL